MSESGFSYDHACIQDGTRGDRQAIRVGWNDGAITPSGRPTPAAGRVAKIVSRLGLTIPGATPGREPEPADVDT